MEPASDIELMQGRSDYVSECLGEKKHVYTRINTYIYIEWQGGCSRGAAIHSVAPVWFSIRCLLET